MLFSDEAESFLADKNKFLRELPEKDGTRRFILKLPDMPPDRRFTDVILEISENFYSDGLAVFRFPKQYVLKIPHIDSDGQLCQNEDPGSISGASELERLDFLYRGFINDFLGPWVSGKLDTHFEKEAINYWYINCSQHSSKRSAVVKIYTTDSFKGDSKVYAATLINDYKIVVAGEDSEFRRKMIKILKRKKKESDILIAEIPLKVPFIPDNWPENIKDIQQILQSRLSDRDYSTFMSSRDKREKPIHKIVLFRLPNYSFGYLLPGGPQVKVKHKYNPTSYYNGNLIPIVVERLDPHWTVGRDQEIMVSERQNKHVLLIGAGALGSYVAEQLAKAGVGNLTIVDDDNLSAANIGRHVLGVNSIGLPKAEAMCNKINNLWPHCNTKAFKGTIQKWLKLYKLKEVDIMLDLTGEPSVRQCVDNARRLTPCPLLISWMEPYVVAAHACLLPHDSLWLTTNTDRLESLQVVSWPDDVIQNEPACSSEFQSYNSSAAIHAVAMATEAALDLIDNKIQKPIVRHWIRGQSYLDNSYPGLTFKEWVKIDPSCDGIIIEDKL